MPNDKGLYKYEVIDNKGIITEIFRRWHPSERRRCDIVVADVKQRLFSTLSGSLVKLDGSELPLNFTGLWAEYKGDVVKLVSDVTDETGGEPTVTICHPTHGKYTVSFSEIRLLDTPQYKVLSNKYRGQVCEYVGEEEGIVLLMTKKNDQRHKRRFPIEEVRKL